MISLPNAGELTPDSGAMSAMRGSGSRQSKVGASITAMVLFVSIVVMVALIVTDVKYAQTLRTAEMQQLQVPAAGALVGQNAVDGSRWVAADGKERAIILFGMAESGSTGSLEYWRDVASRTLVMTPSVKFVGLCVSVDSCSSAPESTAVFTLLKYMDPVQTHALLVAEREGHAFYFKGDGSWGRLPIGEDRQAFAAILNSVFHAPTHEGGT